MPSSFLNQAERETYTNLPKQIEDTILRKHFSLSREDKRFIQSFNGHLNQVAIALQMGMIRYLGFIPDAWEVGINHRLQKFVMAELKIDAILPLQEYANRKATHTFHLQQILKHIHFRKWQPMDEPAYEQWLIRIGMEHDNQRWLLESLCQKLLQDKILRPSINTLERIIGGIDELLYEETYRRLDLLGKKEIQDTLDKLLEVDLQKNITIHKWLCSEITANSIKSINLGIEKIQYLQGLNLKEWSFIGIPFNRRKRLANIARNNTNQYLQRLNANRRYPILACFLIESLLDITDDVLTIYHDFWTNALSDAKNAYEVYQLSVIKSQNQAVKILTKASELLIDERMEQADFRKQIFENLPKQQISEAIQTVNKINKPLERSYLHFLLKSYARFKHFTPQLLKTIEFKFAFDKDYLDKALILVSELQNGIKKKLPESAPTNFISPSWQKIVYENGSIQNQAYELCVLLLLRDRLQSGDVYVEFSRKYADFNSFLIPKTKWMIDSEKICLPYGGLDITHKIDVKVVELQTLMEPLSTLLSNGTEIRLEDGILIVPPVEAEKPSNSAILLQDEIKKRLPQVGLSDMIREVDSWTNYTQPLPDNYFVRNPRNQALLFAALMGNACNLSLADLARACEMNYQSLWWITNNYFTDENLKKANDLLVNFHHRQWISSYWGNGALSSSDGQKFQTAGKIRNAKAFPKYFGYGTGVDFYTHTSDQYSQYGTKVIAATERDSTYVLDEILANETDLNIFEHTTDTHGYTDLIFALFDLVDLSFASRIKDIKNLKLYKIKSEKEKYDWTYPNLKFTGTVNIDFLKINADEMKRVAASLKSGTVSASLLISKLQAFPRQNNLMAVLQSYGQLCKTVFICKYLLHLPLRHRINTQLNKGEQLHNLRAYLWFGGDGIIRKKQQNDQQIVARALNVLTNIVMVWNTVYIQEILKQLQKEGFEIKEDDFVHISPAPFQHINRLGKYFFNTEIELAENGLRPLRKSNDIN